MFDFNDESFGDSIEDIKKEIDELRKNNLERDRQTSERELEEARKKGEALGRECGTIFYSALNETFDNLIKNPTPEFKAWLAGESDNAPNNIDFRIECLKLLEKQAAKNGWEETYHKLAQFTRP